MIFELYEEGVNNQIFEAAKKEVITWDENKKYCSILFEVALDATVTYDKHREALDGFVEFTERTNDFADNDQALVFMLRGAIYEWDQPFEFYFCKEATSGVQLNKIITDVVTAVTNTGLLPVALISDQGTAFQSAVKDLIEITQKEQNLAGGKIDDVIIINGHTFSIIFDPLHLMKGLRNNFLMENIKYDDKISKWSDIVEVYKKDYGDGNAPRLLKKLSDEDVIPEKINKEKVKNCVKVFSKTVAGLLAYTTTSSCYMDGTAVSKTLINTAKIVSFFDDLFDSVSGASMYHRKNKRKALRHVVMENSINHTFWKEAVEKLEKIKFVNSGGEERSVPSIRNWIITLKSLQRLWHLFKTKGIKIMRPRHFHLIHGPEDI